MAGRRRETEMDKQDLWVLDGGMGRELARRGAPFRQPEWSALALMEAPETVREVHQAYATSGARVITTNSYALVPFHIGEARFAAQGEALAALAGQLARGVADEQGEPSRWPAPCRRSLAPIVRTSIRPSG